MNLTEKELKVIKLESFQEGYDDGYSEGYSDAMSEVVVG